MNAQDAEQIRNLMSPESLDICLVCGGKKGIGYLTCQRCRGTCPDRDCHGNRTKSWDYDQCSNCNHFLQSQPKERWWFVYLCDDRYIGMTSDLAARDAEHEEDADRAIIWHTPDELQLDVYQAFKFEWALDAMGALAVEHGNGYLAKRFEMITGFDPLSDAIANALPLFWD